MSPRRVVLLGLAQATGTTAYVTLVVLALMGFSDLAESGPGDGRVAAYAGPVGLLLLFIISACVTGAMVLGYPAVLALRQRIREAILLVAATVAWLVLFLVVIATVSGLGVARTS